MKKGSVAPAPMSKNVEGKVVKTGKAKGLDIVFGTVSAGKKGTKVKKG